MADAIEKSARIRRRLNFPGGLTLCLCGLLLYALSPGPVIRIFFWHRPNGPSPAVKQVFQVAYYPLEMLYRNSDAVRAFYDWYFKLWGVQDA
jgi:hypothetical protein